MYLPNIVERPLVGTRWKTAFYDVYAPLLLEEDRPIGELTDKVSYLLKAPFHNFSFPLNLRGCLFLCSIFYDEYAIRLSSLRPGQDFFLASLFDKEDLRIFVHKIRGLNPITFPSVYQQLSYKINGPELLKGDNQDYRYKDVIEVMGPIAEKLLGEINSYKPTIFEKISNKVLSLTTTYALLRIHLLKFVAILASLDFAHSEQEIKRILLETLRRLSDDHRKAKHLTNAKQFLPLPPALEFFFKTTTFVLRILPAKILGNITRWSVRFMARRFIAGETIEKAEKSMLSLFASGRDATLDRLGELVVSKKEADHYRDEVVKLIRGLFLHINKGERNKADINKAHVSIKVSALCVDFKPWAFDYTYADAAPRLVNIFKEAHDHKVFINIDAEHYFHRDTVFQITKRVLLETPKFKDYGNIGFVLQAYLRDSHTHLEDIISLAKERGLNIPIRLVKGAYWDAETTEASAYGFEAPEFLNKEETDLCFRQLVFKILDNSSCVQLCLASHNFSEHVFCEVLRERHFPKALPIEHQCLHMTSEGLSNGLVKMNWAVRNYIPIGPLITGMAYLVRRILENSSQVGVLTFMRSQTTGAVLQRPEDVHTEKLQEGSLVRDVNLEDFSGGFVNICPTRLYIKEEYEVMKIALKKFQKELGKTYHTSFPLSGEISEVFCPSDTSLSVGRIRFANEDDVAKVVSACHRNYSEGPWPGLWKNRVSALIQVACRLLVRRGELASLVSYESGKTLLEALGDVDEAIDFLNFYAREETRLQKMFPQIGPRGVAAVVAPWNFPLAIPCGMTAAALVAGNTVLLKSAEQTPLTAQVLVDIFHESGVDRHTLIHLPGIGESIGAKLIADERISTVAFTGSKNVGLAIQHTVSKRMYENKRTNKIYPAVSITEMGGKNGIIVTDNAELDETVAGILYSTFGHSGQKCSACSRVIVSDNIKERLTNRLKEAIGDLKIGPSWDFSTTINPLITKEDKRRIQRQVKEAVLEVKHHKGRVVLDRTKEAFPGYLVGPTFFEIDKARSFCEKSFLQQELFGPVLHLVSYRTLDEALAIFNSTNYALTGGIYSQSQDDIDYLSSKMRAGNIYVNRSITGARVAVEPFGGFQLSGTGPKAGGRHYVERFHRMPHFPPNKNAYNKRKSFTSYSQRVSCVLKAVDSFTQIFQHFYKDIRPYYEYIRENLESFLNKKEYNRRILGQISFNNYSLKNDRAVFVVFNNNPSLTTLFYFFSALSVGTKITVLAMSEESYSWWKYVSEIFIASKISRKNFDIYNLQEDAIEKNIQNPFVETVIIDGTIDEIKNVTNLIFDGKLKEKRVRKVLTPLDAPPLTDISSYLRAFVYPRSFAINTMRHGALLEGDPFD